MRCATLIATMALALIVAPEAHARHVTVQQVAGGIASTWDKSRWERGQPRDRVIHRYRVALAHAKTHRHRRAIRLRWRRAKRSYYEHRLEAKEQERIDALTPYECGNGVRSALPCYIPWCESRYDWDAYNPSSGATGFYQFLPSSYYRWCTTCDWSREDQHRAAGDYYAAAGGAPWVCA